MILKVFAVRDEKADAYAAPFFLPHVGMAIRSFEDEVNNKESQLNKHSEDFALYEVGSFDDVSGKLIPLDTPKYLERASDCKKLN